jgi:hypothetical protein
VDLKQIDLRSEPLNESLSALGPAKQENTTDVVKYTLACWGKSNGIEPAGKMISQGHNVL